MSFIAPVFAWIAAAAAIAIVALHLLAWRRPPETPLPTARFAPESPVRTVSRAVRPADLALLALRVLLVLLVGGALAGLRFEARAHDVARVVVVDRSGGPNDSAALEGSARAIFRTGDALVVFDSAAREVLAATRDSVLTTRSSVMAGSLSAALIVAIRAARRLEQEHDSVEIVVVSRFGLDEIDAATAGIRQTWQGAVRVVRAGALAPNDSAPKARPDVRAANGDPVAATLALVGTTQGGADVRVVRGAPTDADTAWAQEGHTLVVWPFAASWWQASVRVDTAFAVSALADRNASQQPATVVAPFPRPNVPPTGRIVARWQDGEPAATETALGAGCIRSVAIAVPTVGDLPLSPTFRRVAAQLVTPCGAHHRWLAASDSVLAATLTAPQSAARLTDAEVNGTPGQSRLATWLLGFALIAALVELAVRRGGAHATA